MHSLSKSRSLRVAPHFGLWLGLLALGCSNSSLDSGVDKNKEVSSITTSEAEQLCQAQNDFLDGIRSEALFCKSYGFNAALAASIADGASDASIQAACTASQSTCKQAYQESLDHDPGASCSGSAAPSGCSATIGVYESCYSDTLNSQVDTIDSYPACSGYTLAFVKDQGPLSGYADTPACDEFQAKCVGGGTN
jgi:hypothetical protein